ncbi:hypothetical protein Tco_0403095, partial [Tanacetum coccineum]
KLDVRNGQHVVGRIMDTVIEKICGNSLHYQDYEWYKALKDSKLKEDALRNKAIMEGLVNGDNDDESRYERMK